MPEERNEIRVLNPRGETEKVPLRAASPRLRDLKGKKIGIIRIRIQAGEVLFPYLDKALKEQAPDTRWDILDIPISGDSDDRAARIRETVRQYDGMVISMAISGGSTTRLTPDAVFIEKMGVPAAFIVTRCFETTARYFAQSQGLQDIAIAPFAMDYVPPADEILRLNLADDIAAKVIRALTDWFPGPPVIEHVTDRVLSFSGVSYQDTYENMEKSFLRHGWSDGLPIVPPTREAVNRMLEGTELPPEHLISLFPPGQGKATVEKIAVNAVMAGCQPQYMPIILSAVDAIIDPAFDLVGVQSTSGQLAPLLIVSGDKLISQLNINDSFCTLGPGWKANSSIGRALKLIMMNIGHTWPGINDMKAFGNPFRYVTLIGENEAAFSGAWEPLRVTEGFSKDQPTLSVMPAMSWQPDLVLPTPPSVERIIAQITDQAKVKYDRYANNCYCNNLVLISPTAFDAIKREGMSQGDLKQILYERIQLPGSKVFDGRERTGIIKFPQWVIDKHKADPEASVPILRSPESLKICVTGGPGPDMIAYIGTWGYGPSHFITKPIKLPSNWDELLKKYRGWESPTVK